MSPTLHAYHAAVLAAKHILGALGPEGAELVLVAIRANWLTPAEVERMEPLAAGLAYLLEQDVPTHRGYPADTQVEGGADAA